MAIHARYQAIPFEPLLQRAMVDREAAEAIQFFPALATEDVAKSRYWDDPVWTGLSPLARQVVSTHPGLLDRTFATQAWDAVYWLLAPNRRAEQPQDPSGLAELAVFGAEEFPSGATATQGIPFRFVRPPTAAILADHILNALDDAHDLFDPEAMAATNVYKAPSDPNHLVALLAQYAHFYRRAAELDECVFVVRD
jgi:hypothetical protein